MSINYLQGIYKVKGTYIVKDNFIYVNLNYNELYLTRAYTRRLWKENYVYYTNGNLRSKNVQEISYSRLPDIRTYKNKSTTTYE